MHMKLCKGMEHIYLGSHANLHLDLMLGHIYGYQLCICSSSRRKQSSFLKNANKTTWDGNTPGISLTFSFFAHLYPFTTGISWPFFLIFAFPSSPFEFRKPLLKGFDNSLSPNFAHSSNLVRVVASLLFLVLASADFGSLPVYEKQANLETQLHE